jgi:hypothetical protein
MTLMLILAKRILNKQYREDIQILLCFSKELLRPFIVFYCTLEHFSNRSVFVFRVVRVDEVWIGGSPCLQFLWVEKYNEKLGFFFA